MFSIISLRVHQIVWRLYLWNVDWSVQVVGGTGRILQLKRYKFQFGSLYLFLLTTIHHHLPSLIWPATAPCCDESNRMQFAVGYQLVVSLWQQFWPWQWWNGGWLYRIVKMLWMRKAAIFWIVFSTTFAATWCNDKLKFVNYVDTCMYVRMIHACLWDIRVVCVHR